MAIAWSRISSKVIAHPPYTNKACRRRCGNGKSRLGACIPHMVDKRKQEVLGEGIDRAWSTVGPWRAEAGATPTLAAGCSLAPSGTRTPCGALPHRMHIREPEEAL